MAGIRIIAYVNSDVDKISKLIENEFDIDLDNSIDKGSLLGINKVGYKSIHYIAKLKKNRYELSEYRLFKDIEFEIQIRTLLQHAWSEIEHDRNYKFSGVLPEQIKRKFALIAGNLELMDMQFEEISNEIDRYAKEVKESTKEGNITNIAIDGTSLREYLINKYKDEISLGFLEANFGPKSELESKVIDELNKFGIYNLKDLDRLLSKSFKYKIEENNFAGLLRDFMILSDYKKYFELVYDGSWRGFFDDDMRMFMLNNVPIHEIMNKYMI